MKILEYTIEGPLTNADKLVLKGLCGNVRGVRRVELRDDCAPLSELSLRLAPSADDAAVDQQVRKYAEQVGLELWSADDDLDRLIQEISDEKDNEATPSASTPAPEADTATESVISKPRLRIPPELIHKKRQVSVTAAVSAVITAVVLAILLTFSLTTAYMRKDLPNTVNPGQGTVEESPFHELEIIDRLFRSATVLEKQDERTLMTAILKGYVAATGDVYAEYFTAEELEEQISTQNGEMCGIGVSVVNGTLELNGIVYQVITVANVYPDSPAEAVGVQPGDHIMYVGKGNDRILVHDVGYTQALAIMKGEEGTECSFAVLRKAPGSDTYEEVEFTAIRAKFTSRSVMFSHYTQDASVGVIRITGFDNTTRDQFVEAVDTLKSEGCTSFVLDLRGNPGGLLSSVEDVLAFFLKEGDTVITTKDAAGTETVTKIAFDSFGTLTCGTKTLTREDVGKYRDLTISVLVNEYSASAAELFTSNIRDYELGTVVGTTTYGKGCGQTTFLLSRYGYEGALKLTTFYYYPPCGEGYDGMGIKPHVEVELSEEAKAYNINLLPHALDNQLAAAVASMK